MEQVGSYKRSSFPMLHRSWSPAERLHRSLSVTCWRFPLPVSRAKHAVTMKPPLFAGWSMAQITARQDRVLSRRRRAVVADLQTFKSQREECTWTRRVPSFKAWMSSLKKWRVVWPASANHPLTSFLGRTATRWRAIAPRISIWFTHDSFRSFSCRMERIWLYVFHL